MELVCITLCSSWFVLREEEGREGRKRNREKKQKWRIEREERERVRVDKMKATSHIAASSYLVTHNSAASLNRATDTPWTTDSISLAKPSSGQLSSVTNCPSESKAFNTPSTA